MQPEPFHTVPVGGPPPEPVGFTEAEARALEAALLAALGG